MTAEIDDVLYEYEVRSRDPAKEVINYCYMIYGQLSSTVAKDIFSKGFILGSTWNRRVMMLEMDDSKRFERIENKIDRMAQDVSDLKISVARIETATSGHEKQKDRRINIITTILSIVVTAVIVFVITKYC